MGVIGLIVASIVNIFLGSPAIMFAISVLGVLIFAGLTAYDTQNIKNTYIQMAHGQTGMAGQGRDHGRAVASTWNFINMFIMAPALLCPPECSVLELV
jgi:FtsH-binding integral membrane protein